MIIENIKTEATEVADETKKNSKIGTNENKAKEESKRDKKFNQLLKVIFYICHNSGFEIVGRIALKDKKTNKIYK